MNNLMDCLGVPTVTISQSSYTVNQGSTITLVCSISNPLPPRPCVQYTLTDCNYNSRCTDSDYQPVVLHSKPRIDRHSGLFRIFFHFKPSIFCPMAETQWINLHQYQHRHVQQVQRLDCQRAITHDPECAIQ